MTSKGDGWLIKEVLVEVLDKPFSFGKCGYCPEYMKEKGRFRVNGKAVCGTHLSSMIDKESLLKKETHD